jgi:hypothetical protein
MPKRGGKRDAPAWFEAQDLHILKAWNNDIIEIQHEISLFGSLKTVDVSGPSSVTRPNSHIDICSLSYTTIS